MRACVILKTMALMVMRERNAATGKRNGKAISAGAKIEGKLK